jgi:ATP-binding cassette subfamily C protein/ATP-binding cassette subfamily C protein EexD
MIQRTLLLAHLLGLASAVIPIIILDLRIALILVKRRIRFFDRMILQKFSPAMRGGIALVWISSVMLGIVYALTSPDLLLEAKYLFNISSAGVLTVNGILIEKFFSQSMYRYFARPTVPPLSFSDQLSVAVRSAASAVQPRLLHFIDGAKTSSLEMANHVKHLVHLTPSGTEASDHDNSSDVRHEDLPKVITSSARHGFIHLGAFSLIINVLMLTTSLYMMQIFDRVLSGHSQQTLLFLTIIAILALAVLAALDLIRARILSRIGSWVEQSLSSAVYLKGLDNALVGRSYRTEALRDLSTVKAFLGGAGILALFDAPWVPVYLGMVYLLNPVLGHIALIGTVLLTALAYATERFTAPILKKAQGASVSALRHAESAFRNAEVIHGMGMARSLAKLWQGFNKDAIALGERASDRSGTISASSKFVRLVLQIFMLGAGALLVLDHQLTGGAMIAASIIMGRALAPVEQSIGSWKHTVAARHAWQRLCELLRQPPLYSQTMALPRPKGHLTIEGVGYRPPGCAEPVLRGLTLEVKPGEVLAITGPSAAGKSTLARLIVGLARPQVGAVRLDGAEIAALDHAQFGRHIGYLPQDVELFPGSVYRNIARMTDGRPEDVIEAAHLAGVHEMILRLPLGYNTEIGEQGSGLSGGQRQRIALARAIYGNPALLVLDEPNASLDSTGEEALGHAIVALKERGSTIIIIAHRPGLLTHTDRIAVLNGGCLDLIGARDEVLAKIARPARPVHVRIIR